MPAARIFAIDAASTLAQGGRETTDDTETRANWRASPANRARSCTERRFREPPIRGAETAKNQRSAQTTGVLRGTNLPAWIACLPVNDLDPRQLASLARFGFDPSLQQDWQQKVADGTFSAANNVVTSELTPPPADAIHNMPEPGTPLWRELEDIGNDSIRRGEMGVCVLNGGMATRFGGVVKGIVPARGERSFLGLAVDDALATGKAAGGTIPVMLMNSFATDEASKAHFAEHQHFGAQPSDIEHFTQFVALRMTESGDLFRLDSGDIAPYGPGHGDFAPALRASGCLQRFQERGGKYVFVRNVDNLGALCCPVVLGHHIRSEQQMTTELAPKWPGDAGGAPYTYEGMVQLVEGLRYPDGFDTDIVDVFNCNTITFSAAALEQPIDLRRYFVKKTVGNRSAVQIEHLIGELSAHLTTNYLKIPRQGPNSRFLPIKKPSELETLKAEIEAIYSDRT